MGSSSKHFLVNNPGLSMELSFGFRMDIYWNGRAFVLMGLNVEL